MADLDIGCGKNKKAGAVGLDINGNLADIVFEIASRKPLPFPDNHFDNVWMSHIIEHVDDIAWLLSEVHRIAKPDANVCIEYPHYSFRDSYTDVTHRHYLGIGCLEHFDPSTRYGQQFQYYTHFSRHFPFKIESTELVFLQHKGLRETCAILNYLVGPKVYEAFISTFLPIAAVKANMRVVK